MLQVTSRIRQRIKKETHFSSDDLEDIRIQKVGTRLSFLQSYDC